MTRKSEMIASMMEEEEEEEEGEEEEANEDGDHTYDDKCGR